jgi:hypothetical protein
MSQDYFTRRAFLGTSSAAMGQLALASLMGQENASAASHELMRTFAPRAKRVICLFQSGGPSHVDLFDGKPSLQKYHGQNLPDSVRGGQRVTGMTSGQSSFPVVQPIAGGKLCGLGQVYISDLLPWTQKIAEEICVIRSMHTEAINHDPAITLANTGSMQLGNASAGAWISYGLGTDNSNLPAFMVLVSQGTGKNPGQPIFSRLWGSGFLPSQHQGVLLRGGAEPVLYLDNPNGIAREHRRAQLDSLAAMNQQFGESSGDAETFARIQQYEMAFRMQTSVPELADTTKETEATYNLYGPDSKVPGTFASSTMMARRLLERGVRFVQIFHRGWDQHGNLPHDIAAQCRDIDQGSYGLIQDLKQRGMLDDTLVIWGGEFGRTTYSQGKLTETTYGRDHHPRAFSIWMAGGGVKGGFNYGETDEMSFNITSGATHVRDLHATILNQLGIDHLRLSYKYQGLDNRLTGVLPARVVKEILA